MYRIIIQPSLSRKFDKLSKKNPKQMGIITKKLEEIIQDPQRYKNLQSPLNNLKRVHIDKSFVLLFSVDESTKTIILQNYDHHDSIYEP
jgi:YafQ family addiction module toxin component